MKVLRLSLVAVVVAAALAIIRVLPVQQYVSSFLGWVDALGVWGPVILAAAYVPATVLFVPGTALTLGSGFTFGVVMGTVVVSVGSTLGSTATFLLGRSLARDWAAAKFKSNAKFESIDRAVATNGFKIVLLTRLSPMFPYNLLGYMYGLTGVRLRDYVLASWIGMLPGTLLYVYLGSAAKNLAEVAGGGAGQRSTAEWVFFGAGLLATLVVTVVVTRVARRAMSRATATSQGTETDIGAGERSVASL